MLPSARSLEGKPVPNVTFKTRTNHQWKDMTTISFGKHITSSTLRAVSGSGTWPQVFIGGKLIGSADDLETYFDARKAA